MATTTKKCKNCGEKLFKDARFCHSCGKQTEAEVIACPKCRTYSPADSKFCFQCGFPINVVYTPSDKVTPIYRLDFDKVDTMPIQLRDAFGVAVSMAVEADGEIEKEAIYLQKLHELLLPVPFFQEQMQTLSKHLSALYEEHGTQAFMMIELQLYVAFQRLVHRFFIEYVPALLPYPLSPRTLLYEKDTLATVQLRNMILDYLMLDEEIEKHYTSAVDIPIKILNNARQAFFQPHAGEVPYIFIDFTIGGSGKEGLILTNKAMYWKLYFHKANRIAYDEIETLKRYKNSLEINGVFLHVSPSADYKLLKLLQHLKRLFDITKI